MNLMKELKNIDNFFESLDQEKFDEMLKRNGYGEDIYYRSEEIMFYSDFKSYEKLCKNMLNRIDNNKYYVQENTFRDLRKLSINKSYKEETIPVEAA